jgi:hypothetical protein
MGYRDAPEVQVPAPAPQRPREQAPTIEDYVSGMSREEMVDYYRTSKKGDPVADLIEARLSQPLEGESPEDTERRLYGSMEDQFSTDGATIAGWADGAAAGGADEIAGAIGGVKSWWQGDGYMPGYERSRDRARETLRVAEEESPWAFRGGNVLGGVTQGLAMGPPSLQDMGQKVLTGAGIGGAQGSLYGFLSGEDGFLNRLEGGVRGAGVGAGLGVLFPLAAGGLGWLKGRWKDKGLDQKSLGKAADMLEDTTMTPQQAQGVAAKQGPEGMLADVNEGMQVATGGTSAAGGAATAGPRLATRREGSPARVGQALDDTFGPYTGPQTIKDAMERARQPAGPAYELAKTHIVDPEDAIATIDSLVKTYSPKSPLGQTLLTYRAQLIDDAGNVIGQGNIVHGIREQLDDEINKLYRAGENKAAARLGDVRKQIDKVLKTQIPGFEKADKIWSDTAKVQDAYDFGKDKLLGKIHPGEVKAITKGQTVPEVDATRMGVRDSIEMDMANPTINPAGRAERILEKNMNAQKLESYAAPGQAPRLRNTLDNEATFLETSNLAEPSRNSKTAPVGAAAQRYWGAPQGTLGDAAVDAVAGAGAGFAFGGPHGAMIGAGSSLVPRMRDMISNALTSKPSSELINKTADLLTRQGSARDAVIADIITRSGNKLSKAQAGRAVDQLVRTLTQGLPGTGADIYLDRREQVSGDR